MPGGFEYNRDEMGRFAESDSGGSSGGSKSGKSSKRLTAEEQKYIASSTKETAKELNFPSSSEVGDSKSSVTYRASGGYAGEKKVAAIRDAAIAGGFQKSGGSVGGGSDFGNSGEVYHRGNFKLTISTYYGSTASTNRFSATLEHDLFEMAGGPGSF